MTHRRGPIGVAAATSSQWIALRGGVEWTLCLVAKQDG